MIHSQGLTIFVICERLEQYSLQLLQHQFCLLVIKMVMSILNKTTLIDNETLEDTYKFFYIQ